MYYKIDNEDTPIIMELSGCMEMIEAEASSYTEDKNSEDKPQWDITLVWLTEDEFINLPDAY